MLWPHFQIFKEVVSEPLYCLFLPYDKTWINISLCLSCWEEMFLIPPHSGCRNWMAELCVGPLLQSRSTSTNGLEQDCIIKTQRRAHSAAHLVFFWQMSFKMSWHVEKLCFIREIAWLPFQLPAELQSWGCSQTEVTTALSLFHRVQKSSPRCHYTPTHCQHWVRSALLLTQLCPGACLNVLENIKIRTSEHRSNKTVKCRFSCKSTFLCLTRVPSSMFGLRRILNRTSYGFFNNDSFLETLPQKARFMESKANHWKVPILSLKRSKKAFFWTSRAIWNCGTFVFPDFIPFRVPFLLYFFRLSFLTSFYYFSLVSTAIPFFLFLYLSILLSFCSNLLFPPYVIPCPTIFPSLIPCGLPPFFLFWFSCVVCPSSFLCIYFSFCSSFLFIFSVLSYFFFSVCPFFLP